MEYKPRFRHLRGLKLNTRKCELMGIGTVAKGNKCKDGSKVPIQEEATYLGCKLSDDAKLVKEVQHRIPQAMATLKRLHLFFFAGIKLHQHNEANHMQRGNQKQSLVRTGIGTPKM